MEIQTEQNKDNMEEQKEGLDLSIAMNCEEKPSDIPDIREESCILPKVDVAPVPQKTKRKKSKKIKRSKEYPKFYRNAYVRYCDSVRPKICEENPSMDSVEITKLVASKWYSLQKEEKQPYIDEARIDKQRFEKELKEYKSNNPEESFEKPSPNKKQKINEFKEENQSPKESQKKDTSITNNLPKISNSSVAIPSTSSLVINSSSTQHVSTSHTNDKRDDDILKVLLGQQCEIPIFTDTFLEHNKVIESEVKLLRKNNIEIEQQNSVLMKHIENMENGVIKIESEIAHNRKKTMQLEVYLTKLRVILSANFNSLQIPGWKGGATVENIDKYMTDLAKSSTTTLNKARDIIKKIDLQV